MNVHINTKGANFISVDGDTLFAPYGENMISVNRSKAPLEITAFNDSLSKSVAVRSRNSAMFIMNWLFYPPLSWVGLLVDWKSPKRYSYPSHVYIDINNTEQSYLPYLPLPEEIKGKKNIFKVTPLKIIDPSNPAPEMSYQRKTGERWASELTFSPFLLKRNWFDEEQYRGKKGYRISLEEKYFFERPAPLGVYLGLEANYLHSKYLGSDSFYREGVDINDPDYLYVDSFGVRKNTMAISLKLGYQKVINRVVLDFYIGLGVKHKNIINFDRQFPDDKLASPLSRGGFRINHIRPERDWYPHMPLNVRVGWLF